MKKILLTFLLFLTIGCRKDEWMVGTNQPFEKTILIFPGIEKSIKLKFKKDKNKVDIGLDFDVPPESMTMEVNVEKTRFPSQKIPGTFMPLVICNVPITNGSATLNIRHRFKSRSIWVAVRILESTSNMCSPTTPVWDDYVVRLSP
jgi:hypothetical protein